MSTTRRLRRRHVVMLPSDRPLGPVVDVAISEPIDWREVHSHVVRAVWLQTTQSQSQQRKHSPDTHSVDCYLPVDFILICRIRQTLINAAG